MLIRTVKDHHMKPHSKDQYVLKPQAQPTPRGGEKNPNETLRYCLMLNSLISTKIEASNSGNHGCTWPQTRTIASTRNKTKKKKFFFLPNAAMVPKFSLPKTLKLIHNNAASFQSFFPKDRTFSTIPSNTPKG